MPASWRAESTPARWVSQGYPKLPLRLGVQLSDEHLPSACEALDPVPSTQKRKAGVKPGVWRERVSHKGLVVSFSCRVTLVAPWHVRRHPVSFTWPAS